MASTSETYMLKEFSISEILGKAWLLFKANWQQLLIFVVVYVLAVQVPSFIVSRLFAKMGFILLVLRIVLMVWNAYVALGAIKYLLAVVRGQKADLAKVFDNADKFVPFLIMYIRYLVVIIGGLICFLIPGIYFGFKYAYVLMLVADEKADGSEAFAMSGRMTEGRKLTMFLYGLVGFFLIMVGLIALVIPGLLAAAVVSLGGLLMYQYLLAHSSKAA